jgi:GT2 family glycosyltransferase
MPKKIKIEIVTPVHDRCDLTLQFLKSLSRIDRRNLEAHIIIVDDGSTDGTADAVREKFPDVEIVEGDGNLWYTAGTNRGLERALKYDPDYILAVNNDSVFDENFLRYMVETAEKYPRSVVGAVLLDWTAPHKIFQVSPKWDLWKGGFRHWQKQTIWTIPNKPWEVELIVGNCVLYPAKAVREAGLMDEKKLPHFGDAEYTPRMCRKGWRLLIEPRARVFCLPSTLPQTLRTMSLKKIISAHFAEPMNPYSLRRRYYGTVLGAPNRFEGLLAFALFFVRLALEKDVEGKWAMLQDEKPLSETFAKSIVED